jgi:gluconate kinase
LEPPGPDEWAVAIGIDAPVDVIVRNVLEWVRGSSS